MDPFEPYLRERWAQGEHNSAQLFTEIREQGFPGSPVLVRQRLARWRVRPDNPEELPLRFWRRTAEALLLPASDLVAVTG